ncbi:TauD/TfdA dioxygenase family protein [Aliikangiella maris]|uniref:TauD/TfdA family dioxygenase n=2 Tax=Aliikangiella maris TaxID=3162458 RepID=A0ABV2BZZ5_9GAMM
MNTVANEPFGLIIQAEENGSLFSLDKDQIEKSLLDNGLLLLRNFSPTDNEQMCTFASQFGDLMKWDFGYVLELQIRQEPENHIFSQGRVELHWDGAFAHAVPRFNFFQCIEGSAESGGGETTFLNTVKFLESLPADQLEQLQDLVIRYETEKKAHYGGSVEAPLISHHPLTNKLRMQFIEPFNEDNVEVNPVITEVVGKDKEEGDNLLRLINQLCYQSRYFYDHQWIKGDYLMVDNHSLLHGRRRFEGHGLSRSLKRIHIL